MKNKFLMLILVIYSLMGAEDKKVVLITGASQGIGYEAALKFSEDGWSVWAASRTPSKVIPIRSNIHPLFMDIKDEKSVQEAIQMIIEQEGKIDVLINNAGYVFISPLEIKDMREVVNLFEVNFFGLARVTNSVLPFMRNQKNGHIINLSSTAGIQAVPGLGYFSASKYALEGYSEALAVELATWGIKVSLLEPGNVETPWLNNCIIQKEELIEEYQLLSQAITARIIKGGGEKCGEVANLIIAIIKDPSPSLRYQSSEKAKNIASNRWNDPTGLVYLKQQKQFLEYLKAEKVMHVID